MNHGVKTNCKLWCPNSSRSPFLTQGFVLWQYRMVNVQQLDASGVCHHYGMGMATQYIANHTGVVRFHMQYNQIVERPAGQQMLHGVYVRVVAAVFDGIYKGCFFICYQIGVVGNARGEGQLFSNNVLLLSFVPIKCTVSRMVAIIIIPKIVFIYNSDS